MFRRWQRDGTALPDWRENLNKIYRKVRARMEHALARMKNYKILRDYRRADHTLDTAASGIACLHNLAITG